MLLPFGYSWPLNLGRTRVWRSGGDAFDGTHPNHFRNRMRGALYAKDQTHLSPAAVVQGHVVRVHVPRMVWCVALVATKA
jgi:hypothetical protein